MKRLALVEIDVDEGDPKRCGADCQDAALNCDESQFCFRWKETLLGEPGIRCLQCLDAETAAHGLLAAAEVAKD